MVRAVYPKAARVQVAEEDDAKETIKQLEKIVSEFIIQYPSHTQRIPSIRPGEHPLIAFVRSMAASMSAKQEQLEKLNQEAIDAANEKERFFASMSHEVRTPMNGIFGMVNLLLEMDLDPTIREHLETIQSSSESLLNIVDDILDYAKLNAHEMPLKPRQFELQKLIREVLLTHKVVADANQIQLSATICETLADRFIADDLRLKQILSNLVSNAIKFTDAGGVSVTVQSHRKGHRNQLLFQVRDTGIGVSETEGPNLFTPFRQIDSSKPRSHNGTGLGLAISKNLVEMMGGKIWFESELGVGSTFFFTIDFEAVTTDPEDIISRKPLPSPSASLTRENGRLRILLVEDNRVNQKVARLALEQLACDVTIASNGREAVDLAEGPIVFDLILMDINMPVMNGFDATCMIRSLDHRNAHVPIIAMTGMVFEEDRERCFAVGMNEVISKPFSIQDLRARIVSLQAEPELDGVALSS